MLVINKNNSVTSEDLINFIRSDVKNDYIFFETEKPLIKNGDIIRFKNVINNITFISDKKAIVDDNSTTFKTSSFGLITSSVNSIKKFLMKNGINSNANKCLLFELSNNHNFLKKRDDVIISKYIDDNNLDLSNLKEGNYVLYNNVFLYKILKLNGNNVLADTYDNTICSIYINYNNEIITLSNCVIPIYGDGLDDRKRILWFYDNNTNNDFINYLLNNENTLYITYDDFRFLNENKTAIQNNVKIYSVNNSYKLTIPLNNTFATNLFQTEIINNDFIKKEINNSINPIVNMEKYAFSPVCIGQNDNIEFPENYLPISEIDFNLHFRKRSEKNTWMSKDTDFWNSYSPIKDDNGNIKYNDDGSISGLTWSSESFFSDEQSDLLGYLNFNNDDVLYQKNKLKKSFIRLLFYDSKDPNVQKLLFYSTIFIDTGTLYGIYTKNIKEPGYLTMNGIDTNGCSVDNEYNPIKFIINDTIKVRYDVIYDNKRLSTKFSVYDKYNKNRSSEGFYIYLYGDSISQKKLNKLYMKVEFNHAGYGRTVPFIMPVYNSEINKNIPISPILSKSKPNERKFPITYQINEKKEDIKGNVFYENKVDVQQLYNDMFIEIGIKYDYLSNKYVWFLPRKSGSGNGYDTNNIFNGKIIFNLFEPKIQ